MPVSFTRRRLLIVSVTTGFATILGGCTGDEETDNGQIEIEYSVTDPRTHDEIPNVVIEHPNPEGFRWIVVEFEVLNGSFDATDIMGLTQIEVQGEHHFTRAVEITSPGEEFLTSSDDSYMLEQEAQGKAYYRVPDDTESGKWVVEQLENQHGNIKVQEKDGKSSVYSAVMSPDQ